MMCHDWHRSILGVAVVVGFFYFLSQIMTHAIPQEVHDLVLIFVTHLADRFGTIVDFFYGSSSGSMAKDNTIANKLNEDKHDKPDTP